MDKQPLAHVTYKCKTCGSEKKFFELYYLNKQYDYTKYCSECKKITNHERILPTDDLEKNYQRPSLFL